MIATNVLQQEGMHLSDQPQGEGQFVQACQPEFQGAYVVGDFPDVGDFALAKVGGFEVEKV